MEKWERGREMIARDLHLVKGAREGTRLHLAGQTRNGCGVGLDRKRETGRGRREAIWGSSPVGDARLGYQIERCEGNVQRARHKGRLGTQSRDGYRSRS